MPALLVSVTGYSPPAPAVGVPLMRAADPPLKARPRGSAPTMPIEPTLAEIAKSPAVPTVNVEVLGLENTGPDRTSSVKV